MSEWVKADVEAFNVGIASLHIECKLSCARRKEERTLCKALTLAREWRIQTLHLRGDRPGDREVLNNLASKGEEMDIVCVDDFEAAGLRRAALRAAESRAAKSIECALL